VIVPMPCITIFDFVLECKEFILFILRSSLAVLTFKLARLSPVISRSPTSRSKFRVGTSRISIDEQGYHSLT